MRTFLIIALLLFFENSLWAQQSFIPSAYPVTTYLPKTYNSDYQNFDITQTDNGLILVGNVGGLLVYDGATWNLFRMPGNNIVRCVKAVRDRYYVGGWGDFGYFEPDPLKGLAYTSLLQKTGLKDFEVGDVWNVYSNSDTAYFLTYHYVFRYTPDGNLKCLNKHSNHGAYSVFYNGSIYIPDINVGLVEVGRGKGYGLVKKGEFYKGKTIKCILPTTDSLILFSNDGSVFSWKPSGENRKLNWPITSFLSKKGITRGMWLSDSTFVLSTSNEGLLFLNNDGEPISVLSKKNGLVSNAVKPCCVDKQNGLWVSSVEGLSRIELGSGISVIDKGLGVGGAICDIVFSDGYWYVSTSTGIYYTNQSSISPSDLKYPDFIKMEGFDYMASGILNTPKGLFIATQNGIFKLRNGIASLVNSFGAEQLVFLNKYNVLLSAGWSGIGVYDCRSDIPKLLNRLKGVNEYINGISTINDSVFWCNTSSGYLLKIVLDGVEGNELKVKSIKRYSTESGLDDPTVVGIASYKGELYASTTKMIYQFDTISERFIQANISFKFKGVQWFGSPSKGEFIAFDKDRRTVYLKKGEDSFCVDTSVFARIKPFRMFSVKKIGRNWFFVNPEEVIVTNNATSNKKEGSGCLVRSISTVQSKQIIYSGYGNLPTSYELSYSNNSIHFRFSFPFFDNESENTYFYILEGFDKQWSGFSVKNEFTYTNLPEGLYRFKVKSVNVYSCESTVAEWSFKVLPPWYRTGFAYFMYFIGFTAVIILASLLYNKRLRKEKLKLELLVKKRTSEIREQNKEIVEKNEELRQQNEEILTQRDEIESQKMLIERKNKELFDSISYASYIQQAVLPTFKELRECLKDSFVFYSPKDLVSGDFYWVARNENQVYCAVSDCTGHGVPGGFLSMLGIAFLTEIHGRIPDSTPAERLQVLRQKVINSLHQNDPMGESKDGMDISLFSINLDTLEMQYAISFGKLIVIHNNVANRLASDKVAIGVSYFKDDSFSNNTMQLSKGDMIFVFTDGYPDQLGLKENRKFGSRRFISILEQIANKPTNEQKQILIDVFKEWQGTRDQVDDVLVLGIRV